MVETLDIGVLSFQRLEGQEFIAIFPNKVNQAIADLSWQLARKGIPTFVRHPDGYSRLLAGGGVKKYKGHPLVRTRT